MLNLREMRAGHSAVDVRLRLRPRPRLAATMLAAGLAALPALVAAEPNDWNPFRERDERARQQRRTEQPTQPPLAPMDGRGQTGGQQQSQPRFETGPGGQFGAPYPGTAQPQDPTQPAQGAGQRQPYPGGPYANNGPTWSPPPPQRATPGQRSPSVEKIELTPLPADAAQPAPEPRAPQAGQPPAAQPPSGQPPAAGQGQRAGAPPFGALARPQPAGGDMPADLWRGIDMKQLEELIAPLEVPPRSPTMHALWTRMLRANVTPPAGGRGANHFLALQLEALYRSGLTAEMTAKLQGHKGETVDPLLTAFRIRSNLVAGNVEAVCADTRALTTRREGMPKLLRGEIIVLGGYCAAIGDANPAAAGLAAGLARDEEVDAPLALAVLDAVAAGGGDANARAQKPRLQLPKRLMVLDYRLMELLGPVDGAQILDKAEPALLVALAGEGTKDVRLRLAAAELAAAMHAIPTEALAAAYRAAGAAGGAAAGNDPLLRRAQMVRAFEAERAAPTRSQQIRALLDDARKAGIHLPMAQVLARALVEGALPPDSEGLGEPAMEALVAAGQYPRARQLSQTVTGGRQWLALADILDPAFREQREPALAHVDDLARRGRIGGDTLHRLAVVLDALDVNVPLSLWEAANKTPQPNSGHLPETGVLPQLDQAAKRKEIGRTILIAMRTLGPGGAEAAHLIALGDGIRALRRAGLEADARRLATEALLAGWPRG